MVGQRKSCPKGFRGRALYGGTGFCPMAHTGAVGVWPFLFGLFRMQGRARWLATLVSGTIDPSAIEEQ
jgi:hypothetical protein